jgi:TP901 family phage tail tape measure protein
MVFETLETRITLDDSGFDEGISAVMSQLDSLKVKAGLAAGAIGAIGFGAATKLAADFESQMTEVAKVTSEATADKLQTNIKDLATEVPLATKKLANIAETAGRLGVRGAQNITDFTRRVAMMETATNLTADEAANSFARMSNALDVPISKSREMMAAVNELSNNVSADTSEISASMLKAAPSAGQLGVKFADLTAIQSTLVASGMQVERAGSRMNRAFTKLAQEIPKLADLTGMTTDNFRELVDESPREALLKVLDALKEIDSKSKRIATAEKIFGSGAGKAINSLTQNFGELRKNIGAANEEFKNADSVNDEFSKAVDDTKEQFRLLVNQLGNFGRSTGSTLLPAVKAIIGGLQGIVGAINFVNRATGGWFGTIVIGAGLIAGFITSLGLLSTFFTATLAPAFMSGAGALNIFNISLGVTAGLTAGIIIALGSLVALLAALATNFGGLADKFMAMGIGVRVAFAKMAVGITNFITGVAQKAVNIVIGMVNEVIGAINTVAKKAEDLANQLPGTSIDVKTADPLETADFATDREIDTDEAINRRLKNIGIGQETQEKFGDADSPIQGAIGDFLAEGKKPGGKTSKKVKEGVKGGISEMSKQDFMGMGMSEEQAEKFASGDFGVGGETKNFEKRAKELKEQLEEDTEAAKEQAKSNKELLEKFKDSEKTDVPAGDIMPDKGVSRTPSTGRTRAPTSGGGATGGAFQINLTNVPEIIDDNSLREFVRQIIKQVEDQRLGDQRRQGAARR